MKTFLVLFLLLCGTVSAVDVSELAKSVKREFGTGDCAKAIRAEECREWIRILEALQERTDVCLVDQASVMRDAERQRDILAEARKMAKRLRRERKAIGELLK